MAFPAEYISNNRGSWNTPQETEEEIDLPGALVSRTPQQLRFTISIAVYLHVSVVDLAP